MILGESWRSYFEDVTLTLEERLREMGQTIPTLIVLTLLVLSILFLQQAATAPTSMLKVPVETFSHRFLNTSFRILPLHPTNLSPKVWRRHFVAFLKSAWTHFPIMVEIPDWTDDDRTPLPEIPPIHLSKAPFSSNHSVRARYAQLASVYLLPFARQGTKIARHTYMNVFLNQSATCTACALIQVRAGRIYVYDPRGVRNVMAPFRAQRLREAIYWIASAVTRGVVNDFEIIVSTMDAIATTCRQHDFRLPSPLRDGVPIFTPVYCNVSHNIPFPLMLADVLRRGLPASFGHQRMNTLLQWDDTMEDVANKLTKRAWALKNSRAVFRGSVRISAFLDRISNFNSQCDSIGRTALWAVAQRNLVHMRETAGRIGERARVWPLPGGWFEPSVADLLDVQVDGSCGGKVHVASRLSIAQQAEYKYVIHAAGNAFWADRLLMTLFGTSAILKQTLPCGMFFEPLLKPFVHFLPVDSAFRNIIEVTEWARANDEAVVEIVNNARQFAAAFLSLGGVQTYVDELLKQYADLLEDREFDIVEGAVPVFL